MFTSWIRHLPLWSWALAWCVALRGVPPPPQDLSPAGSILIADSTQPSPVSVLDGPGVSNMNLSSLAHSRVVAFLPQEAIYIDDDHVLHPFFHHQLDVGPIRLTSIAHVFNYRIAVLRDGAKLAVCV